MTRRSHWTLLLLLLLSPWVSAQVDERALKAAYLFNFIQFTLWPIPPEEPFQLCVLGRTPIDGEIDRLQGRPVLRSLHIHVRHVEILDSLAQCHALYLDDTQRRYAAEVTRKLGNAPVLTITDSDGLSDLGWMLEIRRRDAKLTFDVNLVAARRVNVDFSAQMLKLASYVATQR